MNHVKNYSSHFREKEVLSKMALKIREAES